MRSVFVALACLIATVSHSSDMNAPPVAAEPPTVEQLRRIPIGVVFDHYYAAPMKQLDGGVGWFPAPRGSEDRFPKEALKGYKVEVRITREGGKGPMLWKQSEPLDVSDGFEISTPKGKLKPGAYSASAWLLTPRGDAHPFLVTTPANNEKEGSELAVSTTVHVGAFETRYAKSSVTDAPVLLRGASFIDNPARIVRRYTGPNDAPSRNVWDMTAFEGKIYFGSGDWQRNTGPAPIFELSIGDDGRERTDASYIIVGEAITRLRVLDDQLYAPDIDPMEGWNIGNIYELSQGAWQKKRSIPDALHVFDVARWDGRLFVSTGTSSGAALYQSSDDGKSWSPLPMDAVDMLDAGRFRQMAVLNDSLIVMPSPANRYVWQLDRNGFKKVAANLFPGLRNYWGTTATRVESFNGALLYTADIYFSDGETKSLFLDDKGEPTTNPLYILRDLNRGAEIVKAFKDAYVTDVSVSNDECLVLTAEQRGDKFVGSLFRSGDLVSWTKIAEFNADAAPYSVAELQGKYYVGLANRSYAANDDAAGAILRLEAGTLNSVAHALP